MYLILHTGERVDYIYDSGIGNIVAEYETVEEAILNIEKFTKEALSLVKFYDNSGKLIAEYENLIFVSSQTIPNQKQSGANYSVIFSLREMTELELTVLRIDEEIGKVVSEPTFVLAGVSQNDITVPARGRKNVQIPISDVPDGYVFGAYRGVYISGSGYKNCAVQFFDSAEGGTKANIAICNLFDEDVVINVSATILFMRDFGGLND